MSRNTPKPHKKSGLRKILDELLFCVGFLVALVATICAMAHMARFAETLRVGSEFELPAKTPHASKTNGLKNLQ